MSKGKNIGYIRVSMEDQNTERQLDGVELDKVFTEKLSGKDTHRPALLTLLDFVREDDAVHVHSMDRLARNLTDLRALVDQINAKGAKVQFHKENLIFAGEDSAMSKLLLNIMGAFAEFERQNMLERQREGIAKAKARGAYKGRKAALTAEQVLNLRADIAQGMEKAEAARKYDISRGTVYNYLEGSYE